MKKYLSASNLLKQTTWLCLFLLIPFSVLGQGVIPDFYRDPGLNPNRSFLNQSFNEHIDPFTGALQLHYVDINLPGNGGFDLKVIRSYNSAVVDPYTPDTSESQADISGVGWTIHFGRILQSTSKLCRHFPLQTVTGNPVLELPDGSKQILTFTGQESPVMLTTRRWRAECDAAGKTLIVYSPDGTRYDMAQGVGISSSQSSFLYGFYTTKITDKNGNYANITYAGGSSPQIKSVTTNDGRGLAFEYYDSGLVRRRIKSITSTASGMVTGQKYSYEYISIPNQPLYSYDLRYYLSSVKRPDGTSWSYSYNNYSNSLIGNYAMKSVRSPQGGITNYSYSFLMMNPDSPLGIRTNVISGKTISTGDSWSFSYVPGTSGNYDTTTVNSPTGISIYKHIGPGYSRNGTVWMVGLLVSKSTSNLESETYLWGKQKISDETNTRLTSVAWLLDLHEFNTPILTQKTIVRDGATYITAYSNFDSYGNAGTKTESGPNGGNRTTTLTYFTSPSKWIINQVKNESFKGSSVVRTFDSNGNLTSITRDDVLTSYSYDSQGNVTTVNLPRGLIHNYSNYKRGIAQLEKQPADVSISRTVSDTGNVTSETNGDGYTTSYGYDGLNRVTSVNYPIGNGVSISYGAASKVAQRGALQEVTNYDGFGRVVGITLGGIGRSIAVDALGRKTFESNPGVSYGTKYTYDILDRVTTIVNADGTQQNITYYPGVKVITNERGLATGYAYRAYGNPDQQFLVSIAAPVASANVLITRNTKDLITAVAQGGLARGYGYNDKYYLTVVTNPETGNTIFGRDDAGNITSKSVGASGITTYSYDGQNRVTSVTYPGATPGVTNTYNKTNRLLTTNTSAANRSYSYDGNGNLFSESLQVDGKTFTAAYTYNGNDQLSTATYPGSGNVISYAPDALGRPTQVSGYVSSVGYWPSGQISQINYANGTTTSYNQNSRLWPSTFSTNISNTGIYFNRSSYSYDGVGNLTAIDDNVDPARYNRTLGYDGINRLATSNGPWGSGSISYNGVGNITSQVFGGSGLSYSYDGSNRLNSVSGARSATYAYDANGNISSGGGNNYTYDGAPNLRCINCANPTTSVQYQYDGTNQRVSVTKAGVKTYEMFDSQGKQLMSSVPTGSKLDITEFYYLGGKRIAQKQVTYQPGYISGLTISPNPAVVNQTIVLTATIGGINTSGTVTFYNGTQVLGTVTVINGVATLSTTFTSVGNFSITASYFDGFSSTPTSTYTPSVLPVTPVPPLSPVIRYRNNNTGAYLLTAYTSEINALPQYPVWVLEGPAYEVFASSALNGIKPVYRFRTDYGGYFYTIYESEKNAIVAGYPSYHLEGIAWYAMQTQTNGTIPIYRFFTPATNTHFYTASAAEKDYIQAYLPWTYEGISQYVWPYGTGTASRRAPMPLPH